MQHRPNNKYGENIAAGYSFSNVNAIKMWYEEEAAYDYKAGKFSFESSRHVVVGIAKSSKGMYYVVANYDPPGNYVDHFILNVGNKS